MLAGLPPCAAGGAGWVSHCWSLQTEIAPCTAPFPGRLRGQGAGGSRARCSHAGPVGSSASAALSLEEARSRGGGDCCRGERSWELRGVAPSLQILSVCMEQGPLWVWCKTAWDWATDGPLICRCRAAWAGGGQLARGCPVLEPSLTARDAPGQAQHAPGRAPHDVSDAHPACSVLDLAIPITAVL